MPHLLVLCLQVGRLHGSRLTTERVPLSTAYDQLMRQVSYAAARSYAKMVEVHMEGITAEINKLNNGNIR